MKPRRLLDLYCGAGGASWGYYRSHLFTDITGVDIVNQWHYLHRPQLHRDPDVADSFRFILADSLEFLRILIKSHKIHHYDVIHASPPCQAYSMATPTTHRSRHPDHISILRDLLNSISPPIPWVIENVYNSPLDPNHSIFLCGMMFYPASSQTTHKSHHPASSTTTATLPPRQYPPDPIFLPKTYYRTDEAIQEAEEQTKRFKFGTYRHRWFESNCKLPQPVHPPHLFPTTYYYEPISDGSFLKITGRFGGITQSRAAMGISWMSRDELKEAVPPIYVEYLAPYLHVDNLPHPPVAPFIENAEATPLGPLQYPHNYGTRGQ